MIINATGKGIFANFMLYLFVTSVYKYNSFLNSDFVSSDLAKLVY